MRLPLAKYGIKEILLFIVASVLLSALLIHLHYHYFLIIPLIIIGFVLYFFRDPHRVIPEGDNLIIAPADGQIIEITEVKEDSFLKDDTVKITIFMSLFNVHINRAPLSGQVEYLSYQKGKFRVASNPSASQVNENNAIGIRNNLVRVLMRQVAGLIARRIVCTCKINDGLQRGERIGMIKFGSRLEIFIPKRNVATIEVKLKDKTKGGETVLVKLTTGLNT